MADYPPCYYCERPMRPNGTNKEDHPGTVGRSNIETCVSCRRAIREGRDPSTLEHRPPAKRLGAALPPRPPDLAPRDRHNRNNLEALIHDRRARGIPDHGRTRP